MKRKLIKLKYRKERVLLSDILPYEIPLCFSNKGLYAFLLENNIVIKDGKICLAKVKHNKDVIQTVLALMFGGEKAQDFFNQGTIEYGNWTLPFIYKITHKENEPRILSIIHPSNQLSAVDFYHTHKESILYYCGKSNFSIRHPSRVAKYKIHKDTTHENKKDSDDTQIELNTAEYDNIRSFFTYYKYSNIHQFYESYKHHNIEKKFSNLVKLDISQCFDSIYTHSISWAIWGKSFAKDHIKKEGISFPAKFDTLMRNMNLGETNGILIGSELARVFAETILQSVDVKIEQHLKEQCKLSNKIDYEILRYVDDYFVFYNKDQDKNSIIRTIQDELREFKMRLNTAKSETYSRPIITDLSIFKNDVKKLLENEIKYTKIKNPIDPFEYSKGGIGNFIKEMAQISSNNNFVNRYDVNSNTMIQNFKSLVKKHDVQYKDVVNFSLGVLKNKIRDIFNDYEKNTRDNKGKEANIIKALYAILDFSFFIYSASPRVNMTIKLCQIILMIKEFVENNNPNHTEKEAIFKQISYNIELILKKNRLNKHTQLETLYLLLILKELTQEHEISEDKLREYLGIEINDDENGSKLNYFSYIVLLSYMREDSKYDTLRNQITEIVVAKLKNAKIFARSEMTMLFFDFISCPFIEKSKKIEVLNFHRIDQNKHDKIIEFKSKNGQLQTWFTNWEEYDLLKELDAKRTQEVY